MRVVMNGLAALKPKTGIGHYVARLHAEMGDEVALYPGDSRARVIRRCLSLANGGGGSGKPGRMGSLVPAFKGLLKHLGKTAVEIHFARHCRALGYQLYHEPNFIPFATGLPTVVSAHDLSVLLHPEWHPADRVRHHERHFGPALRRAEHILTLTHEVRRELIDHLGVKPNKITPVWIGVGDEFRPLPPQELEVARERLKLPPRYFLCVGTIEPRKNILTVLKAFADLPANVRESCPLVLAGPWGWKSEPEREFLAAHPAGVIRLGYVSAADLPAIYGGATALLFPSHYEGFGLPPVEMLACGGGVIASNSSAAVREVVGRHAAFVETTDVASWREVLHRTATDRDFEAELRRGGTAHARQFTWKRAATETLAVYRQVLGLKPTAVPVRWAA
ncbi:glycosyltransferase family 4 protein [Limnoglobus roseus]|uniref:GT4 family glycosyltransferase n=1 Tax=Limnoglobus roseus TaxID=2598579 RepID=A0A5C1A2K1_9BACT|nr:glycosyltransferase family 1 protein [Limnoglobus roseus]QEL13349.1 GT4 family glycosyltransferase [Limnoglobus roseus]